MKKLILLTIISIKIFALDSFTIKNLILEKKELELKKVKYKEENYSLSRLELLNFDIQILEKEMELEKMSNSYNKEKLENRLYVDLGKDLLNFHNKKESFFVNYLNTMKKNKDKFSPLDLLEAELVVQETLESKKDFLDKFQNSEKNLLEFYNDEFEKEWISYEKWLGEKIKLYETYIEQKNYILAIIEESKINKELQEINTEKTKNSLENELKSLQVKKMQMNKSKELIVFKLKNSDKKLETYKLKIEKKDKELNLGLITQKEYFDFYNEYFNTELNKKELEKQLKLLEMELEL